MLVRYLNAEAWILADKEVRTEGALCSVTVKALRRWRS